MKIAIITGVFFPTIGGAEIVIHNIMKKYEESILMLHCLYHIGTIMS